MTKHRIFCIKSAVAALFLCLSFNTIVSAHHGSHSSSHHTDTHSASTESSYYYCDGHPAHFHANGACPYQTSCRNTSHHHNSSYSNTSYDNTSANGTVNTTNNTKSSSSALKLNKSSLTLLKGKSKLLLASDTSEAVVWSSSDESVATVSQKGRVTAVGKGTATITATAGSEEKSCTIKVETPKLSEYKLSLNLADSHTLTVTGTKQKITWSSSNSDIVWIDDDGTLVASETGTATITASIGTSKTGIVRLKCRITVTDNKSEAF